MHPVKPLALLLTVSVAVSSFWHPSLTAAALPHITFDQRRLSMSEIVKRADAPVENTWKLEDLFPNRKAWDQEYEEVKQLAKKAEQFQGKLNSAESIGNCFKLEDELSLKTERVYVYAHLHHDEDTAEPTYQGLSQKAKKLGVEVSESLSL